MARIQLDTADAAERLGLTTDSFRRMRLRESFDAPDPDGYIGRSPWWWSTTIDRFGKKRKGRGRPAGKVRVK